MSKLTLVSLYYLSLCFTISSNSFPTCSLSHLMGVLTNLGIVAASSSESTRVLRICLAPLNFPPWFCNHDLILEISSFHRSLQSSQKTPGLVLRVQTIPSPMQVLAYKLYLAQSLTYLIMYFLSPVTMAYFYTRKIRSFNPNFDGTMTSQHLVSVDGPALEDALAVDNPPLKEALTPAENWGIEATLPPTDDTGLEETVTPREDQVVIATLPPTDSPSLVEEEVCFEVCLLNRVQREAWDLGFFGNATSSTPSASAFSLATSF